MNRRAFYFWLERLKINPAERKAVSLLSALLIILAIINTFLRPGSPYEDSYYEDLERVFKQRAALLQQEDEKIMARYQPEVPKAQAIAIAPDTLADDSLGNVEDSLTNSDQEVAPGQVNINTADAGRLETLPGIGPVYARRIIEYRAENGSFSALEELLEIKGIGKKRLEKLKPFVKLKGSTENQ